MAEFVDIAPVQVPSDLIMQDALNGLVRQLNERFRELSVARSAQIGENWGTEVDLGNNEVVLNRELPKDISSGTEERLGTWTVTAQSPVLLIARGVFEDITHGSTCLLRIRARDTAGPVLDEVTVDVSTNGVAKQRAPWTLVAMRQSPVVTDGSAVQRVTTYVLTGQVSGGSAAAKMSNLKVVTAGLF